MINNNSGGIGSILHTPRLARTLAISAISSIVTTVIAVTTVLASVTGGGSN
jgi:hypothetical protein